MRTIQIVFAACGLLAATPSIADSTRLKISCHELAGGNEFEVSFDSKAPLLVFTFGLTGGQKVLSRTFLSDTSACGVKLDFARHCASSLKELQGESGYSFNCDNGIIGDFSTSATTASFNCAGPGVGAEYVHAVFTGCARLD